MAFAHMLPVVDNYDHQHPALFTFTIVPYSLVGAMLDSIGFFSTATIIVWLVSSLQPLFKRVRDSCRACQPPEGRAWLLWSAVLIPIIWVAAAALYFRNLVSLWHFMGAWLGNESVNRPLYALLHLHLFFLLVCGIYPGAITFLELFRNRQVFIDLFMIARFNTRRHRTGEDLEAQHGSSSTDPIDVEGETPSAVVNIHSTSPLPQDENSRRSGQESHDAPPTVCLIREPEYPTDEDAWPGIDTPVGQIITRTVYSPLVPMGGGWNNSEAPGPSNEHDTTIDSDDNAITMTPSSFSSSDALSGTDETEYVNDDRYGRQGVRLREPREDRKHRNTNALQLIDQRRCVGECREDHDPYSLYYASPRLNPQDQDARTEFEALDIREPNSPCDSCSSAHAETIPTAKRSPARVPITPTSPTADANDADTEKTDVERKQRERKNSNSETTAPQGPHIKPSRRLPPSDTKFLSMGIAPNYCDFEENTGVPEPKLGAEILEQRQHTAASTGTSGKPKPKPELPRLSAPALYTRPATQPQHRGHWEAGLPWRSREAGNSDSGDVNAYPVSSNGYIMVDPRTGMRRRVKDTPRRKHPGSPNPFVEGRKAGEAADCRGQKELTLEIPGAGIEGRGREGKGEE